MCVPQHAIAIATLFHQNFSAGLGWRPFSRNTSEDDW